MSTEPRPIKVVNTAPSNSNNIRANEIMIETAKTGKVTAVVARGAFCKKRCNLQSANSGNEKLFCQKAESANFLEENSRGLRNLFMKKRKGRLPKKLASNSKKLEQNSTTLTA